MVSLLVLLNQRRYNALDIETALHAWSFPFARRTQQVQRVQRSSADAVFGQASFYTLLKAIRPLIHVEKGFENVFGCEAESAPTVIASTHTHNTIGSKQQSRQTGTSWHCVVQGVKNCTVVRG